MKLLSNPKIIKTAHIGLEFCSIIQRYEVTSKVSSKHAFKYVRQKFDTCTNMTNAGINTVSEKTTLPHNAYSRFNNASPHATPQ